MQSELTRQVEGQALALAVAAAENRRLLDREDCERKLGGVEGIVAYVLVPIGGATVEGTQIYP